jgi:hypothetical protein
MSDRSTSQKMQALIADKGQTRLVAALQATKQRRQAAKADVHPLVEFWLGVVRNFVLGVPFTGFGFITAYKTSTRLDKHWTTADFAWLDLAQFIPAAILLLIGLLFLATSQCEAVARFLGLGGFVDKVIDRLPWLKGKEAAP